MSTPILLPADGPPPSGAEAACALAWRLFVKHRHASETLLEALCAADWVRAGKGHLVLAVPPEMPTGAAWDRCLAVGQKAVDGLLAGLVAGAEIYHRAGAKPAWAAGLTPVAEVEGFQFYVLEG